MLLRDARGFVSTETFEQPLYMPATCCILTANAADFLRDGFSGDCNSMTFMYAK